MRKKTTILKMIKTKTAVKIVITLIPYVQKAKQKIAYIQYRYERYKTNQIARDENYNN